MKCDDIQKYIPIYLDGEFGEKENIEIESHLTECRECKQVFSIEQELKNTLKSCLSMIHAPKDLKVNIINQLSNEKILIGKRRFNPFSLSFAVPAAAALIILVIFIYLFQGHKQPSFAEDMAVSHEETTGNQVLGNAKEVETFLKSKTAFPVKIPIEEGSDIKLIGARIVEYRQQPAVLFMYKYKNSNLSVIGYPDNGQAIQGQKKLFLSPKSRYVTVDHARGYSVATFNDKGINHSLVSDMAETELLKIIPASY